MSERVLDGLADRLLHRRGSRFVLPLLVRLGLSPNAVTLGSLALGLAAAWQFLDATPGSALAGLGLMVLHAVADHADGDLARLTGRESVVGRWLDLGTDTLSQVLMVLGMAATAAPIGGPLLWVLGAAAAAGILVSALLVNVWPLAPGAAGRRVVLLLANRDALYVTIVAFIVLLWQAPALLPWLLWVLAIGSHAYWIAYLVPRRPAPG